MRKTPIGEIKREKKLVPTIGAASAICVWFGNEKSDTEEKTVLGKICRRLASISDSGTTKISKLMALQTYSAVVGQQVSKDVLITSHATCAAEEKYSNCQQCLFRAATEQSSPR